MSSQTEPSAVEIERFARVFVKGVSQLPGRADCYYDPERGYYYKLHLDDVTADEAASVIRKASQRFDVELVRRVSQDGLIKERVYLESREEAPPDKKVHEGPSGGLYYETGVRNVATPDPSDDEVEGSDTRNVAMIHWEDIDVGDEIVYEPPDGDPVFAEITSIEAVDGDADTVEVRTNGDTYEAVPGTFTVNEPEEKAEGSVTSSTAGVHSARYGDDEADEEKPDEPVRKDEDGDPGPWVSFVGPQGGSGWVSLSTGQKRYQKRRPGEGPEDLDEGEFPEGWTEPPDDLSELVPGQTVEVNDHQDEFVEAEFAGENEQGYPTVELDDGSELTVGPELANTVTAVEDVDPVVQGLYQLDQMGLAPADTVTVEDEVLGQLEGTVGVEDDGSITVETDSATYYPLEQDAVEIVTDDEEESEGPDDESADEDGFDELSNEEQIEYIDANGFEMGETVEVDMGAGPELAEITGAQAWNGEPSHIEIELETGEEIIQVPDALESVGQSFPPEGPDDSESDDDALDDDVVDAFGADSGGGEEEDGEEPDAEAIDEVVADPPGGSASADASAEPLDGFEVHTADVVDESFDFDDANDWGPLSEYHFPSGVSSTFMRVGETDAYDGSTNEGLVFGNFYGGHDELGIEAAQLVDSSKEDLGRRQMTTYHVATALDGNVPTCTSPDGGDTVYVEGVEGENIGSAPQSYLDAVDKSEFLEEAAKQIICGNNDAHYQNVLVTPDGDPVFHDIDHSSGPLDSGYVGKKTEYSDALDRVLGELWRSAQYVLDEDDAETGKQQMLERAKELAEEIADESGVHDEAVNQALSRAAETDAGMAEDIEENLIKLATDQIHY